MSLDDSEFNSFDQEKFVEIPDDECSKFFGKCPDIPSSQIWMIERYLPTNGMKSKSVSDDINDLYWQKTTQQHVSFNAFNLQPGDIVDVLDKHFTRRWYETLIRGVGTKENDRKGMIAIHYIGYNGDWDEWIDIKKEHERFRPRYSKSKQVHTRQKKKLKFLQLY